MSTEQKTRRAQQDNPIQEKNIDPGGSKHQPGNLSNFV